MALSIIKEAKFAEKHSDVKQTLQQDVLANRSQDPASAQLVTRLKALCSIHEALLREEQRQMKTAVDEEQNQSKKGQLPEAAKLAILWGA
mmetsp:Transcript_25990/g.4418  ORF Transcript_25990/g.4418 Transcript_25990/m.4418 type:complete len:90 (+) Transcript_25990:218-487(+)|eukprot:CAMPEP_0168314516 /NCGR_PEP_ID=MMETSP0210-20121227/8738_1 /TAXON_ID=40633 /ORGANISM="Condylostoma magnum, Strain COL2" /LENGTH=89 /DNA_ID=CAMNT_0008283589 /DNA_START=52 /DNA_END=321 /DNA_ORIENTATION=+